MPRPAHRANAASLLLPALLLAAGVPALLFTGLPAAGGQTAPALQHRAPGNDGTTPDVPVRATGHSTLPPEAEGEYPFSALGHGTPLDTIEIYFDSGRLQGYMETGSEGGEHGAPVTYEFARTHADGRELSWTTRRVHDTWWEFTGQIVRGATPGCWLLTGQLTGHGVSGEETRRLASLRGAPGIHC